MKTIKTTLGTTGTTLLELVLLVALIASVAAAVGLFFPKSTQFLASVRHHYDAHLLSVMRLQELKRLPYPLLVQTPPRSYFASTGDPGCDCSTVNYTDPTYPGTETLISNGLTFKRYTCINNVERTGSSWTSHCPGVKETSIKNIEVEVAYRLGKDTHTVETETLISQNVPLSHGGLSGNLSLTLQQCSAPGSCTTTTTSALEIAVYQQGILVDQVIPAGSSWTNPIQLTVPQGSNYVLQVQEPGYFPFHQESITIGSSVYTIPLTRLNSVDTFGSKMAGEVFVADHPVLTKIVAQVSINPACSAAKVASLYCPDPTEAIEIYNPTLNTYTLGSGTGIPLKLEYCRRAALTTTCNTFALTEAGFTQNVTTLKPNSYFLIEGVDFTQWVSSNYPWGKVPDISYDVNANSLVGPSGNNDLIDYLHGGGIKLLDNNNNVLDTIRWAGVSSAAPADSDNGPWTDANPLLSTNLQPATCTP